MSRDSGEAEYFDSLYQCKARLREIEMNAGEIGYLIWFAYATPPNGKDRIKIHEGNYYLGADITAVTQEGHSRRL